jgi:hypothetical protein
MSGSGGGGYSGPARSANCKIVEQTALNSVQAAARRKLEKGMQLDIRLTKGRVLEAHLPKGGGVAGSVTPDSMPELIACIEKGHSYQAVVVTIDGAFIEVEIRPR